MNFKGKSIRGVVLKKLKLAVKGMHCAACSSRIEKVVGSMDGVETAAVNLAAETMELHWDDSVHSFPEISGRVSGMGFELESIDAQHELFEKNRIETAERLARMKKQLIWSMLLAVPLFCISMGEMIGLTLPELFNPHSHPENFALVQFVLVVAIMFLGRNFYINGIPALLRRVPNMDSLIAVGTGAAFIYSTWNMIEIFLGIDAHMKAMDLYFESAGVLIALVSLGKYLETRSRSHTSDAITKLMQLTPETSILLVGEDLTQKEISAEQIKAGDLILIRPGDRIPVDGQIVKGHSVIDESMLTGESLPVSKKENDTVVGGTLNSSGVLHVLAQQVGQDTMLSRIVRLVQDAQGSKAPIASMADRISLYFVPIVMCFAVITGIAWYFSGNADFSTSLRFFIAVMVIACPCAMGLATPTSIMVGTGRGAQLGVLIKSGESLEMAEKTDVVVFDKTGTLTHGKPKLTDVLNVDKSSDIEELLFLAASCEQNSEHPLAKAIVGDALEKNLKLVQPRSFEAIQGKGIMGEVDGKNVLLGNKQLLEDKGIGVLEMEARVSELSAQGKTVLFLAVNGKFTALFGVADTLKDEVPRAVKRMREMGLRLVMLTGDQEKTARAIAEQAGIKEVISEVLPEKKADVIKDLQKKGLKVSMVGDGINDAPALARADVGIAMGTGIDIAIESGDIVIMKGNLDGVITALDLSRAVMRNIRQNLFWAFAYNVVGIPVAAGVLTLFGGPSLNPMIAGAAMALSSVSVVTNALRLRLFSA
jgi:P-type Cu+ transporter